MYQEDVKIGKKELEDFFYWIEEILDSEKYKDKNVEEKEKEK